ncbi:MULTISPECIES: hypothetical protein [unclassified Cupriavidus]|uniref:hypothetical protein n=1 Tax=unclassified Cupriavidus TaxID=2640874 RepID=UPI0012E9AE1B|nr:MULTISPECIES: hypothetical protein [unclassified Cupriavidus]
MLVMIVMYCNVWNNQCNRIADRWCLYSFPAAHANSGVTELVWLRQLGQTTKHSYRGYAMHSALKVLVGITIAAAGVNVAYAQQAPDNAVRNADGSRTILRSQQLPDANARHAQWCKERGGVDITNEGDLTLDPQTTDAIICRRVDSSPGFTGAYVPKEGGGAVIAPGIKMEKSPSIMPSTPPAWTPQQLREQGGKSGAAPSPRAAIAAIPTISVHPNNGYAVKVGELFHAASYAVFSNFTGNPTGRVSSRIPALNCGWTWNGVIDLNPKQVDGFVGCTATWPGVIGTTMQACVGMTCANGEGSFVVEPKR